MLTAIAASLLGASLGRSFGTKQVYLAGLGCGLLSMALLIISQFAESDTSVAFPLLLVATAFLGLDFGLVVPALNTLTFVLIAVLPSGDTGAGIAAFALAGIGCSALRRSDRWRGARHRPRNGRGPVPGSAEAMRRTPLTRFG